MAASERKQWNVRLPPDTYAAADERRKALGLSRDTWTARVIEHALTIPNPHITQPEQETQ